MARPYEDLEIMSGSGRQTRLLVGRDLEEAAALAATEIARTLARRLARRARASLVLSGGSTPSLLYSTLGRSAARSGVDWSRIELFFGDERCVAPENADSNFSRVESTLLAGLPTPAAEVHRVPVELGAERAASEYERTLRSHFAARRPRFDCILLGLGGDGHTASLFPGTGPASEDKRWVVPTLSPAPPHCRVSLSLRVLNAAQTVIFLVTGRGKAEIVRRVHMGPDGEGLPAARVQPVSGDLVWILDRESARLCASFLR